jgi:fatty-acyl-CoA synthase
VKAAAAVEVTEDDTCFLQFTSGSTAAPKGVMVTHRNLVANAHAIVRDGLRFEPGRDRGVTWLPLYHDMGLIGFVLAPLLHRIPVVFIQTLSFVKRPSLWMETISKHRGTLTFGPNFAFAVAAKHAARQAPGSWDLSCLRVVGCGAEPIQAGTLRRFVEAHAAFGLDPRAVMPSYGMAEGTLALSFDRLDAPFRTVVIDRAAYERDAQAVPVAGAEIGRDRTELVACGRTFPGHRLAIMGQDGSILPERAVGEIVFRGPSVTAGYFGNQEATRAGFRDGWLHTGDLGFLLDGELYVSGRQKDLIILNGRNYYPQAIEWEVERVAGIRKGNVVAFAVAGQDSERLIVAAETALAGVEDLALLLHAVKAQVAAELGLAVGEVVLLSPGALPKTSSGKVQRRLTGAEYERGTLGRRGSRLSQERAPWLGVVRHLAAGALARLRHLGPARLPGATANRTSGMVTAP